MATYNVSGAGITVTVTYSISDGDASQTISISYVSASAPCTISGLWDGGTDWAFDGSVSAAGGGFSVSTSKTVSKAHSGKSEVFEIVVSNSNTGEAAILDYTFTVGAKTSYAVSFDGNGATGGNTLAQTKWYNESLALRSNGFTRAGWTFAAWNTKADGTGTSYAAGSSYTGNAALTMYAQWKRNIDSVTIGSTNAIRVDSSSSTTPSDEGTYAYVTGSYTVSGAAAASISVTATCADASGTSHACSVDSGASASKTTSQDSYTGSFVIKASGCDTDTNYVFTVTVTETNTSETQTPTPSGVRGIILTTAFFTIDVKEGGHGLSFGAPAVDDCFNVAMQARFKSGVTANTVNYATCSTGDGTSTTYTKKKAVLDGFVLSAGAVVRVKFTAANTYKGLLYLNVNSTGDKAIYANKAATSSSNPLKWLANTTMEFYYDGTYWVYTGNCTGSSRQSTITEFYYPSLTASTAPAESAVPVLPCKVICGDGSVFLYDGK